MDLKVTFSDTNELKMEVQYRESGRELEANFRDVQIVTVGGEVYTGDYDVTPKVDSQTIPTKGKLLVKDMTINPIPFFNVSNTHGGTTVYIAKEM